MPGDTSGKADITCHSHNCRSSPISICVLIVLLLVSPYPPVALPAHSSDTAITATPSTIARSLPLGTRQTQTITLTNTGTAQITPLIYEAFSAQGDNVLAARQNVPGRDRAALPAQATRIDDQLLTDFRKAPDHRADFLVYFHDQPDLGRAYTIGDWAARGHYVYQTLVEHAEHSQRTVRADLQRQGLPYRPFWIVNAIQVHGTAEDAFRLGARAEVALVRANRLAAIPPAQRPAPLPLTTLCSPDQPDTPICWNLRKIGVDRVWHEFGVMGQGVVVANIDTGVNYSHVALAPRYRGNLGAGRYNHNYNWFDPQETSLAPFDSSGHGTHTMGSMVAGGNGTFTQPAVGMAPGSQWIAAQGCDSYHCSESDLLAAAQWILAPTKLDGTLPRPDLRPMIVNNSWGGNGDDPWYAGYTAAWRAAGIFPVFAAGNGSGPRCGSLLSPGDYPDVLAVGATDATDQIASFSRLGPAKDGRIKPDVVAPGTYQASQPGVLSTSIGDSTSYQILQGTSMATPLVSGLVALLWSANPALIGDYDTTYGLIRDTAVRLSDTRCGDPPDQPNNVYGHGRIDAYAAIKQARVDLPWLYVSAPSQPLQPGTSASVDVTFDATRLPGPGKYTARLLLFGDDLGQSPTTITIAIDITPVAGQGVVSGRILDAETAQPLTAIVGIQDGPGVATDQTGVYTLTLAPGTHRLKASARSFLSSELLVTVTGDLRLPDIVLQPDQPHVTMATTPISVELALGQPNTLGIPIANIGTRPLAYQVKFPAGAFSAWRSDEPGGPIYRWVDLPADAPMIDFIDDSYRNQLPLGIAFPFFSSIFTETLVTSDGTLGFSYITYYVGPSSPCLPGTEQFFYMIAPFRADLDPSKGGRVRYGTTPDRKTFVLSYEQVPLDKGSVGETYTFQVLLHDDGRIVFQYQKLAPLPNHLSVGIQYAYDEFDEFGCGATTQLHDSLAIELRPQVRLRSWLGVTPTAGTLLPGQQQELTLTLTWVRPHIWQPYRGKILIATSDPYRPQLTIPVQLTTVPAPREYWVPLVHR